MKVYNCTSGNLMVDLDEIVPNESINVQEMMFNSVHIHSDTGSVVIITEYSERTFKTFGDLIAREIDEIDDQGLKCIEILEV